QQALDLPDILFRQAPVVITKRAQIDDRVGLDTAGEIDVRVEVAERQRSWRRENGFSAVQTGITRPRHGSPSMRGTVDKDHVVQQVDRFKAQDERRIAMLL